MPAKYVATWRNLLDVSSALQDAGLVIEFNGTLETPGQNIFEITTNRQEIEGATTHYFDEEQDGFYRASEYADSARTRHYTVKFLDGGLARYLCVFRDDEIVRQCLSFFQSPLIRPYDTDKVAFDEWIGSASDVEEEARLLFGYPNFEYRDLVSLRIDFAPHQYRSVVHPTTHMHVNNFESCRIPVIGPMGVAAFFRFLTKNFYAEAWTRLESGLVDTIDVNFAETIDGAEQSHFHVDFPV